MSAPAEQNATSTEVPQQKSRAMSIPASAKARLQAEGVHHLSVTPGGTIFGVTPGGTRRIYDRNMLLAYRASPLSKSPAPLPHIPGVTTGKTTAIQVESNDNDDDDESEDEDFNDPALNDTTEDGDVFEMEN